MKKIFLSITTILFLANSFAQVTQVSRTEMEWDEEGVGKSMVIGDKGLIVYGEVNTGGDTYEWKITPLNVNLKEKSAITFTVPKKYYYKGDCKSEDNKMV
ncbi:MAG TPA: hypothetical protein VI731_01435, partial [Bacteroidia bacterium]|nr:hypothetical protein [Bacteroidia bacterium]